MVGYPVAVEKAELAFRGKRHTKIPEEGVVIKQSLSSKAEPSTDSSIANNEWEKSSAVVDEHGDTFDPAEEEKMRDRFKRRNDHRPS